MNRIYSQQEIADVMKAFLDILHCDDDKKVESFIADHPWIRKYVSLHGFAESDQLREFAKDPTFCITQEIMRDKERIAREKMHLNTDHLIFITGGNFYGRYTFRFEGRENNSYIPLNG